MRSFFGYSSSNWSSVPSAWPQYGHRLSWNTTIVTGAFATPRDGPESRWRRASSAEERLTGGGSSLGEVAAGRCGAGGIECACWIAVGVGAGTGTGAAAGTGRGTGTGTETGVVACECTTYAVVPPATSRDDANASLSMVDPFGGEASTREDAAGIAAIASTTPTARSRRGFAPESERSTRRVTPSARYLRPRVRRCIALASVSPSAAATSRIA